MSYYRHHLFFCTNQRPDGSACCQDFNAREMCEYAKNRTKELGIAGREGCVRVNSAGCLNRCEQGPVVVVYPEGVWYTYVDKDDLDEIIDQHLLQGRIVDRLKI